MVKFPGPDNSSLAVKGLIQNNSPAWALILKNIFENIFAVQFLSSVLLLYVLWRQQKDLITHTCKSKYRLILSIIWKERKLTLLIN